MSTTRTITAVMALVAAALFAESLHLLGVGQIVDGLARIGWGFAAILLIAGARDVVRAIAWTLTIERPDRLGFLAAFRARLAGEALNTLVPMGMVVGEPAKASHVAGSVPFGAAFRALAVEFAFYGASLVPLFAAGVAAFAIANRFALGVTSVLIAETAIVGVATLIARRLLRRVPAWKARRPRHVAAIAACEAAYQVLAVAEVYVTLLFISPQRATVVTALVLETVSRAVTIFFKMIPMRIGVDEASSSFVAGHISLEPATGLTLALVRKLRMLFWSAVGLALFVRRRTNPVPRVAQPSAVFSAVVVMLSLLGARTAAAQEAGASVTGSVAIASPDGAPLVMPGVTVTLRCAADESRV